jgi:biotin carboxylase
MKIHEYQAKELFRKYDVPVPEGGVAFTPDEAVRLAGTLGGYPVVVKAQIHAGGRGKGGGVKLAQSGKAGQKGSGGTRSEHCQRALPEHHSGSGNCQDCGDGQ